MNKTIYSIQEIYHNLGVSAGMLNITTAVTLVILSILLMVISYYLLSRMLEPLIARITQRTQVKWDDLVFRHSALKWVWMLLPLIVGKYTLPAALYAYPTAHNAVIVMLDIALIIILMMLVIEIVKSVFLIIADHDKIEEIAAQMQLAKENGEEFVYKPSHSLKGLQQMLTVLVIGFSIILCISVLFGKNPLIVLSGLGAAAAVLMLVFQDSILGVVAGVQLTANDMLQPGDWINVPKFEANGVVQEVTLAAVKVKNWDHTTVTIPPYKLLTEGFQNWRSMEKSRARRIARSINIDMSSMRFATEQELQQWTSQKWWRKSLMSEDGKIANLTVFRAYLEHYITTVPTMKHNLLFMVRELQPTADGLPLEVYLFTSKTDWKSYEWVQANLIDRVIAVLPEFGLRVYQRPTGADIRSIRIADSAVHHQELP